MGTEAEYQVFISYRRDGGDFFAQLLYDRLEKEGYRVFLDVESLRAGKFNEALLQVIEQCPNFICVLPPKGLDRCASEEDWVRKEIAHAIRLNKRIIPVMLRGFEFPENLPADIAEIRNYQAIKANDTDTFPYAMQKLIDYLDGTPKPDRRAAQHSDPGLSPRQQQRLKHLDVMLLLFLGAYLALFLLIKHFYNSPPWMPAFLDNYLTRAVNASTMSRVLMTAVVFLLYRWALDNNYEYNHANCAQRLISIQKLNQSPEQLLKEIIEISAEQVSREIDAPEEAGSVFAVYRAFAHLEIGSVDGKQVDYLLAKGYHELYHSLCVLCLSNSTIRSASVRILAKQGFAYLDGKDKDIARFQCGDFELKVLYGSFGMSIIGLELRRNVGDFSRLMAANEPHKQATLEQNLLDSRDGILKAWKDALSEIKKDVRKDSGDDSPPPEKPPAEEGDDHDPADP